MLQARKACGVRASGINLFSVVKHGVKNWNEDVNVKCWKANFTHLVVVGNIVHFATHKGQVVVIVLTYILV